MDNIRRPDTGLHRSLCHPHSHRPRSLYFYEKSLTQETSDLPGLCDGASLPVDHVPLASQAKALAGLIVDAWARFREAGDRIQL